MVSDELLQGWPRRLLHVPTMTSHPWQPGNTYGIVSNPKYSAVSYTWGRAMLKSREQLEISAVAIDGIDWPIPRIDPMHAVGFTAEEFHNMIKDTVSPHPKSALQEKLEFLWLDVACIHQTDRQEMMQEIGRQAEIFKGACRSYVWLRQDKLVMETWNLDMVEHMDSTHRRLLNDDDDFMKWIVGVTRSVRKLFADPWFSSLWTLQEAFLCPEAEIIMRSAKKNASELWTLDEHVSQHLRRVQAVLKYYEGNASQETGEVEAKLWDLISGSFPVEAIDGNPMALLAASHRRTASLENDRVYGIMQVFQLRLGASDPARDANRQYSLSELEDELAVAVVAKYPVHSQIHIHSSRVPIGDAWRVSKYSVIPEQTEIFFSGPDFQYSMESRCELSANALGTGSNRRHVGHFSGSITLFAGFIKLVEDAWLDPQFEADLYAESRVFFDGGMYDDPNDRRNRYQSNLRHDWLARLRPNMRILLLGTKPASHSEEDSTKGPGSWYIGLLLSPPTSQGESNVYRGDVESVLWRREGIYIWKIGTNLLPNPRSGTILTGPDEIEEQIKTATIILEAGFSYLAGEGDMWETASGCFG